MVHSRVYRTDVIANRSNWQLIRVNSTPIYTGKIEAYQQVSSKFKAIPLMLLPCIGVGTGGARGARPPQCWSYQRYFNCENRLFYPYSSHFCNNFWGLKHKFQIQKFLLHALHTLKTGMCTHNYYVHTSSAEMQLHCVKKAGCVRMYNNVT